MFTIERGATWHSLRMMCAGSRNTRPSRSMRSELAEMTHVSQRCGRDARARFSQYAAEDVEPTFHPIGDFVERDLRSDCRGRGSRTCRPRTPWRTPAPRAMGSSAFPRFWGRRRSINGYFTRYAHRRSDRRRCRRRQVHGNGSRSRRPLPQSKRVRPMSRPFCR